MYRDEIELNKTTKLLYWGMFELLGKNTFDKITVNDICKRSLVSRSTFYSYFQDKYHLVLFCLDQERERLGIIKGIDVFNNLKSFLERIKEKDDIYRNLFIGQTNRELNNMIVERFKEIIEYNLSKNIEDKDRLEVLSVLYSTGMAGTVMWWINNDFSLDIDSLAKYQFDTIADL